MANASGPPDWNGGRGLPAAPGLRESGRQAPRYGPIAVDPAGDLHSQRDRVPGVLPAAQADHRAMPALWPNGAAGIHLLPVLRESVGEADGVKATRSDVPAKRGPFDSGSQKSTPSA